MEFKFAHQGISVQNLEESIQWYKNVFDAEVVMHKFLDFLNCDMAFLRIGKDALLELFEYMGPDKKPTPEERWNSKIDLRTGGNKHVCYEVDSLRKFYDEKLVPYNVFIDHGPEHQDDDWMMFIRDPNGIVYEIFDFGAGAEDPHAFDGVECRG